MGLTKVTYSMIDGAPLNVLDFGADNTGSDDSTSAIQAAIDAATTNGGTVYLPNGTYIINGSGSTIGSREYGLLLKSNVALVGESEYGTVLKAKASSDIDLINTNRASAQSNIQVKNLTLDGNQANRGSSDGFNLWVYNITDLVIENVNSIDPTSWGLRIEKCDTVQINHITCNHGAYSNTDGVHFVDTDNVVGSSISIVTAGDDGFVIQANAQDVVNYAISGIYVNALNGLSLPSRGILFLLDDNKATGAYKIKNVNLSACVIEDASGHGVCLSGASLENVKVDAVVRNECSFNALTLFPGTSIYAGYVRNCSFNVLAYDVDGSGMGCSTTYGTLTDNEINVSVYNPGDNKVGVGIEGDYWTGSVFVDYDPNATKVSKSYGVVISGDYNSLKVSSKDAQNNLYLTATAQNNIISNGVLKGGVATDLLIASGSTNNTITGCQIFGTISNVGGATNKFYGTSKANDYGTVLLNFSTNADGTASFNHNLGGTPTSVLLQIITATSVYSWDIVSITSTAVTVRLYNSAAAPVVSGSYYFCYSSSL